MAKNNRTIAPKSTQGENFKSLLQAATGKDYADIGEADVERWASAQGWRGKDVKRIVKGFTKFSKRDNTFNLTAPGEFRVEGASGSGRRKGNRLGFGLGDIVGLGRDVSLLGGALETVQTGGGEEKVAPDVGGTLTTDDPFKLEPLFTPVPDEKADVYTPSGAGVTQAAAQRNQDIQTSRSPKQTIVPEGPGDIAFSPNEVFDRSPLLQREGLGLLNVDPNDFGGNVRLGDAPVTTPKAAKKEPEQGIDIYGFDNPIGKNVKGYYEILEDGSRRYVKSDNRRYKRMKEVYEEGGERDIATLMGKATRNLGNVFDLYKKKLDERERLRTPSEMLSGIRRFGGKTKFSR